MHSKFYSPDRQRAEKVHQLFATIARRYDLLNDIMSAGLHRRWKRRLVSRAALQHRAPRDQPMRVLDLCCGTGDIALRFARSGARVVGADFTAEMLQVAQSRRHRPPVAWIRADALQLPFRDNSFDVVSVGYGLRNLADCAAGLREIRRVLRPGGALLSLDFGKPQNRLLRWLYFGYLRTALPLLGRLYCGDPDTHGYILVSLQHYQAQHGIRQLMESTGFGDCGFEQFLGGTMAINYGRKPPVPPAR
jgi:demethylmenaquinone methyltransferase/2-methoxy-6-polyprenyl-1,4-benzoquinol methylase